MMPAATVTPKRLSISDQVGLSGGRHATRTGGGAVRSPEAPHMAFSPSSGSDEDEDRHAKSSSDELETSRNNRSSDEELPPYPAVGLHHQTHVLRTWLPMPP